MSVFQKIVMIVILNLNEIFHVLFPTKNKKFSSQRQVSAITPEPMIKQVRPGESPGRFMGTSDDTFYQMWDSDLL